VAATDSVAQLILDDNCGRDSSSHRHHFRALDFTGGLVDYGTEQVYANNPSFPTLVSFVRNFMKLFIWGFFAIVCQSQAFSQTQCRPDAMGGANCVGPNGITQIRPDGMGGQTIIRPDGSIQQQLPDGMGGTNNFGPNGVTQTRPDGMGGTNTLTPQGIYQTRPDGMGGTTTIRPGGQMRRCRPDGMGGTNCY